MRLHGSLEAPLEHLLEHFAMAGILSLGLFSVKSCRLSAVAAAVAFCSRGGASEQLHINLASMRSLAR